MDLWKLLTSALTIVVGLLIYERFIKPTGVISDTASSGSMTVQQEVEQMLKEESL